MNRIKRLKPDRDPRGIYPAIFAAVVGALAAVFFGIETGIRAVGVTAVIYSTFALIAAIKTSATAYRVGTLYIFSLGMYALFLDYNQFAQPKFYLSIETKFFLVWVIVFAVWLTFLTLTKRSKWRGRDIMEAAAEGIPAKPDCFTERPRPIETVDLSESELRSFADFLRKNLIALPVLDSERILFVPVKMGEEFGVLFGPKVDFLKRTWISFSFDGNVSVNISKEYYLDFVEDLDFDSLCESLGRLFVEFFELYRKGEEVRIIDKLNEMKIGILS